MSNKSQVMGDCIVAPASALFPAQVAIVRLSGAGVLALGAKLLGIKELKRGISRRMLKLAGGEMPVDLWSFKRHHSFTGEESLEIHLPGSPVLVEMLLERVREFGVRDAEAGEFTRRAFLNGRLDLAQAEAIMALVSSVDADGVQRARRLLEGKFSRRIQNFVGELEMLCARFEVAFDFDEEAAEQVDEERFRDSIEELTKELRSIRRKGFPQSAERARIVLIGATNVGKSTLFNAILGQTRAAVADEEGTTRDEVEAELEIEGVPLSLIDSAGLLVARDAIEDAAVARTQQLSASADLVVAVIPAQSDGENLRVILQAAKDAGAGVLVARTMIDRAAPRELVKELRALPMVAMCAPRGDGVPEIRLALAQEIRRRQAPEALPVTARAANLIHHAAQSLEGALEALGGGMPLEVASDVARAALADLRSFLGDDSGSDVLDTVFRSFCIGK